MTNTVWWLLDEHGLVVAFVLLFLEESGLPPVIPGDLLMVLVGVQAAQGRFWLPVGLLALELATMLGGSVLYWLSSLGGHAIVHRVGRHVGATPERLHRLNLSLERHGQGAIVVGRLIPSLCILTAVAAGLLGYPYRRFLPALAVGGLLHLLIFVLLGYWVGRPVLRILSTLHPPFELTAAALALAGLVAWLIWSARRTPATPIVLLPRPERLRRGLLAGLLGALVSTLLANIFLPLGGLFVQPSPFETVFVRRIAEYGSVRLVAVAVVVASLVVWMLWGALYGVIQPRLPGPWWLRGVLFALVPLGLSLFGLLPLTGSGLLGLELGAGLLPLLAETIRALAYGLTLGIGYAVISPHRRPRKASSASPPRSLPPPSTSPPAVPAIAPSTTRSAKPSPPPQSPSSSVPGAAP